MTTIFKRIAMIVGVLTIAMLLVALTTGIILAQTPDNPFTNFAWGRGPGMMGGRGMMGFTPDAAITGTAPYGRGMMGGGWGMGPGMMGGRGMMGFGPGSTITETTPYGCSMMGFGPGSAITETTAYGCPMRGGGMMGNGPMWGWQQGLTSTTGLTGTWPYGPGGMMGRWMMGRWGNVEAQGEPITVEEARQAAEQYLAAYNDPNLAIDEVMTFSQNFYVQVKEKEGNLKAFELLVNPYTSFVHPEPGPNMMWNTKYSHMAQWSQPAVEMTVTPAQASEYAQKFLDTNLPGVTVDAEVESFPGYYTIHTLKDGQIEGMLSVNGYTGQVWYHNWHGDFQGMTEIE